MQLDNIHVIKHINVKDYKNRQESDNNEFGRKRVGKVFREV